MVEVEVPGLEYSHNLQSFCRFSVEGNGCGVNELADESLKGGKLNVQATVVHKSVKPVQQGVHTEEGFLGEGT